MNSVHILLTLAQPSVSFKVVRVGWGQDPNAPIKAYPGDTGQSLTVEVQNLSPNETIKGVTATLMLQDSPFTDTYGSHNATAVGEPEIADLLNPTDEILPKGFFTLTFNLNIDENALPRAYQHDMILSYSVNSSGTFLEGEPKILSVNFVLSKIESTITCAVSPQTIEKGKSIDVSGSINPVQHNVTVNVAYKNPSGSTFDRTVKTNIAGSYKDTYQPDIEGVWSVNASWTGDTEYEGDWASTTFEVRFATTLNILTSENRLIGGLDNQFTITLTNSGQVKISTIDVTLNIPLPLIIHGDNQWTFDYLNAGNSTVIALKIFAPDSVIGSTYSGSLNLNYQDYYGATHTDSYSIGLIIRGQVELVAYDRTVNLQSSQSIRKVIITATVLNKGSVTARYVNATILLNTILNLTAESTTYIGEIEENAPVPFTLSAILKDNVKNGSYPLAIEMTYLDDQYRDCSIIVTFNLIVEEVNEIQNGSEDIIGFPSSIFEIALVLLIILGAATVILFLYRSQSTKNRAQRPRNLKQ
jgi:hypothetical protein